MIYLGSAARRPVPFAEGKEWCGGMKMLRTKRHQ
jgi:hypothetical protein